MRRLFTILAVMALALILAPVALAADGPSDDGQVLFSINGPVDISADQQLDALIVVGGDARIAGEVTAVFVVGGDVELVGATIDAIAVIDGDISIDAATTVTGDVRTLSGTATVAPGADVRGEVKGLEGDVATLGLFLAPVFVLFAIGVALVTLVAALVVAALAARQVRNAEALISRQPGQTVLAGLVGMIGLPLIAVVSMVTIVGAPIGLFVLFFVLPAVAYLGWIVAAIWVGDWLTGGLRETPPVERPYRAAIVGVIALGLIGIVPVAGPFVSAIASLFGYGALLLLAWRTFRHEPLPPLGMAAPTPMPA
jgi:hypothetical protein